MNVGVCLVVSAVYRITALQLFKYIKLNKFGGNVTKPDITEHCNTQDDTPRSF